MRASLLGLYEQMTRARSFELALAKLWEEGRISGEMHLGTGEEAVAAAVALAMLDEDAIAIDHRATPVLTALGVDLVAMLREVMGDERGLCRGWGGHMHLYVPERRAASSGIVGAAGPAAVGFALSAKRLRKGSVAVALFGDGAMNQGMLMEAFNLAACWELPVLFVCKDNGWAITTKTTSVTGGNIVERAASFGLATWNVDGGDLESTGTVIEAAFRHLRTKGKPCFIRAECPRLDGHFLGDPLLKIAHSPLGEGKELFSNVVSSTVSRRGGGVLSRTGSMMGMLNVLRQARKDTRGNKDDPLERARASLRGEREYLARLDANANEEVAAAVRHAMEGAA